MSTLTLLAHRFSFVEREVRKNFQKVDINWLKRAVTTGTIKFPAKEKPL